MASSQPPETYHINCVQCGYLLRGLAREGRCSECGLRIETSLAAKRPEWSRLTSAVERLARARPEDPAPLERNIRAWLRCVALGPATLALLVPALAAWQWWRRETPWWERVPEYPLLAITWAFAVAVWLTTRPDRPRPPAALRDPYWSRIRTWLRLTALAPAASAALACYSEVAPAHDHPYYAGRAMQLTILFPAVSFLLFDYLAYLAYLARRMDDPWFAGFFRASMILSTAVAAVTIPGLGWDDASDGPTLFPDLVGGLVEATFGGCCSLGGMWCVVVIVAMLDLSLRMWRLAGEQA